MVEEEEVEVVVKAVHCIAFCILCPKIICLSEKDLFCQIFSEFYICSDFCDPSINLFSPLSPTEQPIDLDGGNSAQKGYFAK